MALLQSQQVAGLYAMRDAGVVVPVARGVYRLASLDPLAHPDLVTAAVPQGVLCLISALSFHELTTQVPHTIDVALERGTRKPRLDYPPTRFFWFSGPAFHEGIETHERDGVPVRSYDPEKTLVDCFRYRNQIGMDVTLGAMRLWRERRRKSQLTQDLLPPGIGSFSSPFEQQMPQWPAWILVVSAGALLVASSALEYRQRSEQGPVAIVPTLPHAFAAAMLAGLAAAYLRLAQSPGFAWWHSLVAFVVVLALGVLLILLAGSRGERKRQR